MQIDEAAIYLGLADGRVISAPLAWFPKLAEASHHQRQAFTLSPFGAHWAELDEDVSVIGLLQGASPNRWDASAKNELLCALDGLVADGVVEEDVGGASTMDIFNV